MKGSDETKLARNYKTRNAWITSALFSDRMSLAMVANVSVHTPPGSVVRAIARHKLSAQFLYCTEFRNYLASLRRQERNTMDKSLNAMLFVASLVGSILVAHVFEPHSDPAVKSKVSVKVTIEQAKTLGEVSDFLKKRKLNATLLVTSDSDFKFLSLRILSIVKSKSGHPTLPIHINESGRILGGGDQTYTFPEFEKKFLEGDGYSQKWSND